MKAHRIEITLTENGTLSLNNLPFQAGDAVEIIILESPKHPSESNLYPLRGTVIRFQVELIRRWFAT